MILFPPQSVFSGAANATFGTSRFTVTLSAGGGGGGGIVLGAGSQTATSGTIGFGDSNGITFGMSGSTQVTASHDGVRTVSAGTTSGGGSVLKFADSNNVSFGWNAGTITATITVPAQTQFVLSASNGLAWGTNGSTVTGSYSQSTAPSAIAAGTQTATSGTVVFSNANNVSFGLNAGTVTASAGAAAEVLKSRFVQIPWGASSASVMSNVGMSLQEVFLPFDLSFSKLEVPIVVTRASTNNANTAALNISSGAVIYSRDGSTLNPIVGQLGTTTYTHASNTAGYSSINLGRNLTWNLGTSLSAGNYYIGIFASTTNNSSIGTATTLLGATISMVVGGTFSNQGIADFGAVAGSSIAPMWRGRLSSQVSNTTQTLQLSQFSLTGADGVRANFMFGLRNY